MVVWDHVTSSFGLCLWLWLWFWWWCENVSLCVRLISRSLLGKISSLGKFLCTISFGLAMDWPKIVKRQINAWKIKYVHIVQITWSKNVNLRAYVLFSSSLCSSWFWQGPPAIIFKIVSYFFFGNEVQTVKWWSEKKQIKLSICLVLLLKISRVKRIQKQRENEKRPNALQVHVVVVDCFSLRLASFGNCTMHI